MISGAYYLALFLVSLYLGQLVDLNILDRTFAVQFMHIKNNPNSRLILLLQQHIQRFHYRAPD